MISYYNSFSIKQTILFNHYFKLYNSNKEIK